MTSVSIVSYSALYMLLLIIIFFSKKRLNLFENKIYSVGIIVALFGTFLEIISAIYFLFGWDVNTTFYIVISRLVFVYYVIWINIFLNYIIIITRQKVSQRKIIFQLLLCSCVEVVLLMLLPFEYIVSGDTMYPSGLAVTFLYAIIFVCLLLMLIFTIISVKKVEKKKFIPLIALLFLGGVAMLIQSYFPEIFLTTPLIAFVTFLTYFTIENPDMKLIEQLNIARDQAERANNAKSEFLSNMSHEIRTPLNAIVGFSQALAEEENVPEEAKDEIKDIMMASQNLLEIVNGILDISKIEAGKLEIVNTEYSLKNVLEELTALTTSRIGEKPITLRTVFDPSIPQVLYGDYVRLKQIVLNLLTNAAKYTKEGYIEFKVDSVIKDDICRLIISVEDTGIGIKKESIDKLFNKFERLDLEKNITIEGTGLGLAITKKLVELMNGSIVVQSEYGNGSKFTVAIDQRIVEGKETVANEINTEIELFDAKDKRILLVDDNKINLKVAVRLLQSYQMQIDQAMSGQECIDKIKEGNSYDLILLDDMMPKMSGVETLKELQKIEGFETPTIAFTANAISGMKEKYLSDGFHDYLSKPIDKLELNQLLKKYLKEGEK